MNKKIKLTVIILLQLVICYFICEFASFCIEFIRFYNQTSNGESVSTCLFRYCNLFRINNQFISFDKNYDNLNFRPISGAEYNEKKPIILFGCSYTHGTYKLKNEQTVSYKLSKLTKRKVYNRAYPAWGPQDMLYQLRRDDFYNIVKEEPEYIIYVCLNHRDRVYRETGIWNNQIFYKITKDGNLKESYFSQGKFPLYGCFAKEIRLLISNEKLKNKEETYQFMLKHFEESKKEIEKHWKNAKFVIFVYLASDIEKEIFKRMRKEKGFNIIFLDELSNIDFHTVEYQLSESDTHPNEKAWDKIVPLLVKKLDIK